MRLLVLLQSLIPPYILPIRAASAIIKDRKGRYLLLKRSDMSKSYKHFWQLPEGKIDAGEKPKQALVRELKEELGAHYKQSDLIFYKNERILVKKLGFPVLYIDRILFTAQEPTYISLSKEHEDYGFFSIKEIQNMNNTLPGLLKLLI